MKRLSIVAVLVVALAVLTAGSAAAQQWTPEQKEIWKVVEGYWAAYMAEDLATALAAVHSDYSGWGYSTPLPSGKATYEKWSKYEMGEFDWVIYELTPAGISIFDGVAVVHYFYSGAYKDSKGDKTSTSGRWTDILKKTGDKWLLIADHGGQTSDK